MKRAPVLVAQLVGLSLVTALAATGCSGDDGPSIVVYNAQHEQLLEEIAPAFTDETGIEVELRNGNDPELVGPAGAGGRRLARRRVPDRELPGDVAGGAGGPVRAARRRATVEPIPAQYRPDQRPVDRLRGPLDRARLQHRPGRRVRAAGLDHGPRRPGVGGTHLVLADRRRLPGDRRGGARARGRGRDPRVARGHQGQRHRLRRQQRRARVGQLRRVRGRHHLPLLLVPRPGRVRRRTATTPSCTSSATRTPAPS